MSFTERQAPAAIEARTTFGKVSLVVDGASWGQAPDELGGAPAAAVTDDV
jgi:hypothetical protein